MADGTRRKIISAVLGSLMGATLLGTTLLAGPVRAGQLTKTPKYPNLISPVLEFGRYGTGEGELIGPRGIAFGPAGTMVVSDCLNNRVQVFDRAGKPVREWGRAPDRAGSLSCPMGVALTDAGTVMVADAGHNVVKEFSASGQHLGSLGTRPDGTGGLDRPTDVAVGGGRVHVTTRGDQGIVVFDRDAREVLRFGGAGSDAGRFREPGGLAVGPDGAIFVADKYNHRVQVFDADGRFVRSIGSYGSYPGELAGPADVTVRDGEVFVADSVNHRVQVFSPEGQLLYQFGRHPEAGGHEGDGHMHYPLTIATTSDGRQVATCEKFEARCQVFDVETIRRRYQPDDASAWWEKYPYFHYRTKGSSERLSLQDGWIESTLDDEHLRSGVPVPIPRTRVDWRVSRRTGDVEFLAMGEEDLHRITVMETRPKGAATLGGFGQYGTGPGDMIFPQGATLDPFGRIWVSDSLNDRLQVFDINGELIATVGADQLGGIGLREPSGAGIDPAGNVFVPDAGNDRIVVLDRYGRFLRSWGRTGTGSGEFSHPVSVALSPDGQTVYTSELYHSRIQRFTAEGRYLGEWGARGLEPGALVRPMNAAVSSKGEVYVTDDALDRISRFSAEGKLISTWGQHGAGPGELVHPQGIMIGADDRIWVIDYGNHRGQTFSSTGRHLFMFGEGTIAVANPASFAASYGRPLMALSGGAMFSLLLAGGVRRHSRRRHGDTGTPTGP
ncbi:MAG: NHL repeat-containing protein [Acidimicrobiia bacterium]